MANYNIKQERVRKIFFIMLIGIHLAVKSLAS